MHIGIDFDNTIVHCDDLFYKCALEEKLIKPDIEASKDKIKSYISEFPRGNEKWTTLQAIVYGRRMSEAVFKDGAKRFIERCVQDKIKVSIISHKTEFDASGSGINLRESALKWMIKNNFFLKDGLNFNKEDVFFESTREEKISRIIERKCTHFIDDLIEVFNEDIFPSNVVKMHYNSQDKEIRPGIIKFFGWNEIYERIFEQRNN